APAPPVLAVHSGAGVPGYAATDRVHDRLAAMVYVDSFPEAGPIDPDFADDDKPLPSWEDPNESLDGISEEQLATFRERAVPEPGAALRESIELTDERRLGVPTTVLCTAWPSA